MAKPKFVNPNVKKSSKQKVTRRRWFRRHYRLYIGRAPLGKEPTTKEVVRKLCLRSFWRCIPASCYVRPIELPEDSTYMKWTEVPPIKGCTCPYTKCICTGTGNEGAHADSPPIGKIYPPNKFVRILGLPYRAPKPRGSFIPKLMLAVNLEEAIAMCLLEEGLWDMKGPDYCMSSCRNFYVPDPEAKNNFVAEVDLLREAFKKLQMGMGQDVFDEEDDEAEDEEDIYYPADTHLITDINENTLEHARSPLDEPSKKATPKLVIQYMQQDEGTAQFELQEQTEQTTVGFVPEEKHANQKAIQENPTVGVIPPKDQSVKYNHQKQHTIHNVHQVQTYRFGSSKHLKLEKMASHGPFSLVKYSGEAIAKVFDFRKKISNIISQYEEADDGDCSAVNSHSKKIKVKETNLSLCNLKQTTCRCCNSEKHVECVCKPLMTLNNESKSLCNCSGELKHKGLKLSRLSTNSNNLTSVSQKKRSKKIIPSYVSYKPKDIWKEIYDFNTANLEDSIVLFDKKSDSKTTEIKIMSVSETVVESIETVSNKINSNIIASEKSIIQDLEYKYLDYKTHKNKSKCQFNANYDLIGQSNTYDLLNLHESDNEDLSFKLKCNYKMSMRNDDSTVRNQILPNNIKILRALRKKKEFESNINIAMCKHCIKPVMANQTLQPKSKTKTKLKRTNLKNIKENELLNSTCKFRVSKKLKVKNENSSSSLQKDIKNRHLFEKKIVSDSMVNTISNGNASIKKSQVSLSIPLEARSEVIIVQSASSIKKINKKSELGKSKRKDSIHEIQDPKIEAVEANSTLKGLSEVQRNNFRRHKPQKDFNTKDFSTPSKGCIKFYSQNGNNQIRSDLLQKSDIILKSINQTKNICTEKNENICKKKIKSKNRYFKAQTKNTDDSDHKNIKCQRLSGKVFRIPRLLKKIPNRSYFNRSISNHNCIDKIAKGSDSITGLDIKKLSIKNQIKDEKVIVQLVDNKVSDTFSKSDTKTNLEKESKDPAQIKLPSKMKSKGMSKLVPTDEKKNNEKSYKKVSKLTNEIDDKNSKMLKISKSKRSHKNMQPWNTNSPSSLSTLSKVNSKSKFHNDNASLKKLSCANDISTLSYMSVDVIQLPSEICNKNLNKKHKKKCRSKILSKIYHRKLENVNAQSKPKTEKPKSTSLQNTCDANITSKIDMLLVSNGKTSDESGHFKELFPITFISNESTVQYNTKPLKNVATLNSFPKPKEKMKGEQIQSGIVSSHTDRLASSKIHTLSKHINIQCERDNIEGRSKSVCTVSSGESSFSEDTQSEEVLTEESISIKNFESDNYALGQLKKCSDSAEKCKTNESFLTNLPKCILNTRQSDVIEAISRKSRKIEKPNLSITGSDTKIIREIANDSIESDRIVIAVGRVTSPPNVHADLKSTSMQCARLNNEKTSKSIYTMTPGHEKSKNTEPQLKFKFSKAQYHKKNSLNNVKTVNIPKHSKTNTRHKDRKNKLRKDLKSKCSGTQHVREVTKLPVSISKIKREPKTISIQCSRNGIVKMVISITKLSKASMETKDVGVRSERDNIKERSKETCMIFSGFKEALTQCESSMKIETPSFQNTVLHTKPNQNVHKTNSNKIAGYQFDYDQIPKSVPKLTSIQCVKDYTKKMKTTETTPDIFLSKSKGGQYVDDVLTNSLKVTNEVNKVKTRSRVVDNQYEQDNKKLESSVEGYKIQHLKSADNLKLLKTSKQSETTHDNNKTTKRESEQKSVQHARESLNDWSEVVETISSKFKETGKNVVTNLSTHPESQIEEITKKTSKSQYEGPKKCSKGLVAKSLCKDADFQYKDEPTRKVAAIQCEKKKNKKNNLVPILAEIPRESSNANMQCESDNIDDRSKETNPIPCHSKEAISQYEKPIIIKSNMSLNTEPEIKSNYTQYDRPKKVTKKILAKSLSKDASIQWVSQKPRKKMNKSADLIFMPKVCKTQCGDGKIMKKKDFIITIGKSNTDSYDASVQCDNDLILLSKETFKSSSSPCNSKEVNTQCENNKVANTIFEKESKIEVKPETPIYNTCDNLKEKKRFSKESKVGNSQSDNNTNLIPLNYENKMIRNEVLHKPKSELKPKKKSKKSSEIQNAPSQDKVKTQHENVSSKKLPNIMLPCKSKEVFTQYEDIKDKKSNSNTQSQILSNKDICHDEEKDSKNKDCTTQSSQETKKSFETFNLEDSKLQKSVLKVKTKANSIAPEPKHAGTQYDVGHVKVRFSDEVCAIRINSNDFTAQFETNIPTKENLRPDKPLPKITSETGTITKNTISETNGTQSSKTLTRLKSMSELAVTPYKKTKEFLEKQSSKSKEIDIQVGTGVMQNSESPEVTNSNTKKNADIGVQFKVSKKSSHRHKIIQKVSLGANTDSNQHTSKIKISHNDQNNITLNTRDHQNPLEKARGVWGRIFTRSNKDNLLEKKFKNATKQDINASNHTSSTTKELIKNYDEPTDLKSNKYSTDEYFEDDLSYTDYHEEKRGNSTQKLLRGISRDISNKLISTFKKLSSPPIPLSEQIVKKKPPTPKPRTCRFYDNTSITDKIKTNLQSQFTDFMKIIEPDRVLPIKDSTKNSSTQTYTFKFNIFEPVQDPKCICALSDDPPGAKCKAECDCKVKTKKAFKTLQQTVGYTDTPDSNISSKTATMSNTFQKLKTNINQNNPHSCNLISSQNLHEFSSKKLETKIDPLSLYSENGKVPCTNDNVHYSVENITEIRGKSAIGYCKNADESLNKSNCDPIIFENDCQRFKNVIQDFDQETSQRTEKFKVRNQKRVNLSSTSGTTDAIFGELNLSNGGFKEYDVGIDQNVSNVDEYTNHNRLEQQKHGLAHHTMIRTTSITENGCQSYSKGQYNNMLYNDEFYNQDFAENYHKDNDKVQFDSTKAIIGESQFKIKENPPIMSSEYKQKTETAITINSALISAYKYHQKNSELNMQTECHKIYKIKNESTDYRLVVTKKFESKTSSVLSTSTADSVNNKLVTNNKKIINIMVKKSLNEKTSYTNLNQKTTSKNITYKKYEILIEATTTKKESRAKRNL